MVGKGVGSKLEWSGRAVAAGPVSPVSTGPLFPVACLALPISAFARRTPTHHPKAHKYLVETCKMAANSATELFHKSCFQQLSILTSKRLPSQASPRKVWLSADKQTGPESRHHWCTTQWAEWHSSGPEKHRIGPKMVSEAIS